MATWQFDLILAPRERLSASSRSEPRIPIEAVDQTDWWANRTFPNGYESRLDSILPRLSMMTRGMVSWGTEDGNRVDLCLEDGRVVEVRARLDARDEHPAFAEDLTQFAVWAGAAFVTEEGEIVEPEPLALLRELRNSSAHRFVVDPGIYLEDMGNPGNRPQTN